MCFICDGGTPDELMRSIAGHIDEYGWHVSGVTGEPGLGWAYTVGLTESFGHPELIMTGTCCIQCGHSMLNGVGQQVAAGSVFSVGDEVVNEGEVKARIGAVHERQWLTDRFNTWLEYYDGKPWAPEPRALQVLFRDTRGRWQNDHRNKRWPFERLDRAPHTTDGGRRLLR